MIISASGLASKPEIQSKTDEMVVKVYSKYSKGHFQRFDCVPLITFSIPLKTTEFQNQKYPQKMEITEFLDNKLAKGVYQGIIESDGSHEQKPVFLFFKFFLRVFTILDFTLTIVKIQSCSQTALPLNVWLIIGSNGIIMYFGGISIIFDGMTMLFNGSAIGQTINLLLSKFRSRIQVRYSLNCNHS